MEALSWEIASSKNLSKQQHDGLVNDLGRGLRQYFGFPCAGMFLNDKMSTNEPKQNGQPCSTMKKKYLSHSLLS